MSKYDKAGLVQIPSGYSAGTLYSVVPTNSNGDFDFTRTSSATRVNKDGLIESVATETPRLDYPLIEGVVQDCPALLLEPQRTNIIPYSESFSNVAWNKSFIGIGSVPVVTANQGLAPDGTFTADRIVLNLNGGVTSGDGSFLSETVTVSSGATVSLSIYLKSNTGLIQNLIVWEAFTGASTSCVVTNEWQRFNVIATVPSTSSGLNFGLRNAFGVTVDDTADILAWGAQLEQGSYATSYIPTSGSAVTRAAETCNNAGTSDTFNDSEGVLYAEISGFSNTDASPKVFSLSDGGGSNRIICFLYNTEVVANIQKLGETPIDLRTDLGDIETPLKISVKYKANDFALWINGFEIATAPSGQTYSEGTLDRLNFDSGYGIEDFYGNTKQIMTFNKALTDSELEDLTSWDSFLEMAQGQLYKTY
jgi:hypothetical protein